MTELIGNKKNIEHLSKAWKCGKLSHAYIINGAKGSGKKTFASFVAAALLCNEMEGEDENQQSIFAMMGSPAPAKREIADGPCGNCSSCIKAFSGNHPDIIWLDRGKEKIIKVDMIRHQIIEDVGFKPYYGPYKIYIIPDAHLMNENGQNALLKTIEEPPEYAIIFLLSDNADGFLDTIKSRCIRMDMEQLPEDTIFEELKKMNLSNGADLRAISSFAAGNLGKAISLAKDSGDEDYIESVKTVLKSITKMDAVKIYEEAERMVKVDTNRALEVMKMWFRDVLVLKAESEKATSLFFPQDRNLLMKVAGTTSYENLNKIIEDIDKARDRMKASVKAEAAMECLLLSVRRGQKG